MVFVAWHIRLNEFSAVFAWPGCIPTANRLFTEFSRCLRPPIARSPRCLSATARIGAFLLELDCRLPRSDQLSIIELMAFSPIQLYDSNCPPSSGDSISSPTLTAVRNRNCRTCEKPPGDRPSHGMTVGFLQLATPAKCARSQATTQHTWTGNARPITPAAWYHHPPGTGKKFTRPVLASR
jgi:hypothetical protein